MTKPDKRKNRSKTIHTMQTLEGLSRWDDDCLEWRGYMIKNLYPQVFHDGSMIMVRRLVMQLAGRETPPMSYYKTSCDNPRCIRLEHIKVVPSGKHMSNMAHAVDHQSPIRIAKLQKAATPRRKLTDEQVQEIRTSTAATRNLAARFGISKSTVCKIKANRSNRIVSATANPFAGLMR